MKKSYNEKITLKCVSCGSTSLTANEDKSYIKCNQCGKEYLGGHAELVKGNKRNIDQAIERKKQEITKDVKKEMEDMIKKAFKGKLR